MDNRITVSALNRYVHSIISGDKNLNGIWIEGEISNFKINSFSGHAYFVLKDITAAVKAVMFKSSLQRIRYLLDDGMNVIVRCNVTLYETDGTFEINVSDIVPNGVGLREQRLEQLKNKLRSMGLFEASRKREIPKYPQKIAVVASSDGAAYQDIINVISRRYPFTAIRHFPAYAQGVLAEKSVIEALNFIDCQDDIDTVIIARGGGSREDLDAFNSEKLVLRASELHIPFISAIGHETDYTLLDYVADLRAPTPSAAAELAVPDVSELWNRVKSSYSISCASVYLQITDSSKKLNDFIGEFYSLGESFRFFSEKSVSNAYSHIFDKIKSYVDINQMKFDALCAECNSLSPLSAFSRGYARVSKDGTDIPLAEYISAGDRLSIDFSDGTAKCTVDSVSVKESNIEKADI